MASYTSKRREFEQLTSTAPHVFTADEMDSAAANVAAPRLKAMLRQAAQLRREIDGLLMYYEGADPHVVWTNAEIAGRLRQVIP